MRIGTKIPWPYQCSLCGRGYGEKSKVISVAVNIPSVQSEGFTSNVSVFDGFTVCYDCIDYPISKLVQKVK